MSALPPVIGPDGKVLQGNALVNAFKGGVRIETANGGERTSRACLACRKLKTRCDGADDPPCKRCRAGGLECVFVESKRGKRPSRNRTSEATLHDKFRIVEKTLSSVLDSIGSGERPDPDALFQLQASIAEGLETTPEASSHDRGRRRPFAAGASTSQYSPPPNDSFNEDRSSSSSSDLPEPTGDGAGEGRSTKRMRHALSSSHPRNESPGQGSNLAMSPYSASTGAPGSARLHQLALPTPLAAAESGTSPTMNGGARAHLTPPPASIPSPRDHATQPQGAPSLAMLADASLAAQIDGRSKLTGLDPNFNLSTVTDALQRNVDRLGAPNGKKESGRTPAVLAKGLVTPELAVELFTMYFDYAYIHLPLLDPTKHTAPWVCATSPFLFTVILAVAARFHPDPTLHRKIYEEAHKCFVECVSEGERAIESVQACCILTVYTYPPTSESAAAGREEKPKRAWLYGGAAVRMGLELNLFRPPAFVDVHLSKRDNASKANPWISLPQEGPEAVTEQVMWDALNRERTWLMLFVIDHNLAAVMGRPYQIQEAKPYLLPLHPLCRPFDLGVIAHVELQTIIGQVMDTFRDRLYGLSCASDEMPSQVVMKLFNSRIDEWKARWCPMPGEPIANNLQLYHYASKLFLNTIPLQTMLRNGDACDDPDSVSSTISAAKSLLSLGHAYAEIGALRHCPDIIFLFLLYSSVFLVKLRVSNSRFSQLVDPLHLEAQLLQLIKDCQDAAQGDQRHSAVTCLVVARALGASWKALETGAGTARSRGTSVRGDDEEPASAAATTTTTTACAPGTGETCSAAPVAFGTSLAGSVPFAGEDGRTESVVPATGDRQHLPNLSLVGAGPASPAAAPTPFPSALAGVSTLGAHPFSNPFAMSTAAAAPVPTYPPGGAGSYAGVNGGRDATGAPNQRNWVGERRPGTRSGTQTPSTYMGNGMLEGTHLFTQQGPFDGAGGVDHFLNDTHFFGSVLIGRGASGFFDWPEVASSLDPFAATTSDLSDPFGFASFSYHPGGGNTATHTPGIATATQEDPLTALGRVQRENTGRAGRDGSAVNDPVRATR